MTGFFTFKWNQPAGEVYVTGTFDNWAKSTKLEKEGDAFIAKVELPTEKTLYKFVVDGNWVVDQSAPREFNDGIENNLLVPEDIIAEAPETEMFSSTINSAAPDSTTASLAAAVPIEHTTNDFVHDNTISSAAPGSSTAELAAQVPKAVSTPGPSDVPGGFPETPATENSDPTPITAGKEQVFSVKPLPASDTPTNPFHLEPGEPIPQNEFTTADSNKHVKLDSESYERADASNLGFGLGGAPVLPDVVTPAALREVEGRGVLDIPTATMNLIPESSLPITSFAATATPDVPEIVKESQEKAHVEPEASAVVEAVELKKEVEQELQAKVPVIPETKTVEDKKFDAPAVAEATTVGEIMAAAGITSASGEPNDETTPTVVPEIVRESQKAAHVEPEASAVEEVVEAKREFEEELKKEMHPVVPITFDATPTEPALVYHSVAESTEPVVEAPTVVEKSPEAVELKKAVQEELKEEVKPTEPIVAETVPTTLSKDEPKEVTDTLAVPPTISSKTENGFALNGNGSTKSEKSKKSEKEAEANGNGTKSPKKSFEGDVGELKKSRRRSLFGTLKEFFHPNNGAKDKGKAKGETSP